MTGFELVLFSIDPALIRRAVAAGAATVIVDWESDQKQDRQLGADTEINHHTPADLRRVRAATDAHVLCRVNAFSDRTAEEVEAAVAGEADELLLPMVRTSAEVEATLELVAGRCRLGILVETNEAVALAKELAGLPLSRVYVGLNDLAIERGTSTIFAPLVDGTLEELRPLFPMLFGFGGLTLPDLGAPVPCRLLIAELARLGCSFSFLRRSFHRDIGGRDVGAEVPRLLAALEAAFRRPPLAIARERAELEEAISELTSSELALAE
jgi:hypothetical protein